MHKNRILADIISMEVLNLEIVNLDGLVELLRLNGFNSRLRAVEQKDNISRFEIFCPDPTLSKLVVRTGSVVVKYVERVLRRRLPHNRHRGRRRGRSRTLRPAGRRK